MTNRLSEETSPYLRQHADNPVDWRPWGKDALAAARSLDRPILLSVGYSACHWCHVMAHECFEDAGTAALMNRFFVNIKVDREERPDIDQIYQLAHQAIVRGPGGWPLTMFLTPQGKPFFGGTYFPKQARYNRPGFDEVLKRVSDVWAMQRDQVLEQGDALVRSLAQITSGDGPGQASGAGAQDDGRLLQQTVQEAGQELRNTMMNAYDPVNGGFGGAPKFPQPAMLAALLRLAVATRDVPARDVVLLTLRRMAQGGLYDHLGGGFYRYSTDEQWAIPHFEKMLYDNGPLLRLYAQAWQVSGEPLFAVVCEETAGWLMREMQAPEGGYFSSVDADSEGEEGRFYVWRRDEVAELLDPRDYAVVAAYYGLDAPPNFEDHAWHLRVARPLAEVARRVGRPEMECAACIAQARPRLFAAREKRIRPGRDDKILTSWNALAIDGMAYAARVFERPEWEASARQAYDFLRGALWREGRLLATHKDGRSHLNAYLDDYAFLLGAAMELMQSHTLRGDDLRFAMQLAGALIEYFEDADKGGFFFTSSDHEALVLRLKSGDDGALASGNAVAALQLQRLGHLTGNEPYLDAASRAMQCFAAQVGAAPHGYGTFVSAMGEFFTPPAIVALVGPATDLQSWSAALAKRYLPDTLVFSLPEDRSGLPQVLRKPDDPRPQAWVCRGARCLPPISEIAELAGILDDAASG